MQTVSSSSLATRVAQYLRDGGPASVNGIASSLQISRTSVENVLGMLTKMGAVTRAASVGTGVGRPSRSYEFDARKGRVAGVDVGNASVRVVISDLCGVVLADHVGPGVDRFPDGAAKLNAVTDDVKRACRAADIPLDALRAVGLSLPGIVNESGRVLTSVVIPEWSGVEIGNFLHRALGVEVAVDNGVRLAAVAEHHLGAAQLVNDILYLSVGNRVAVGLILDGKPRRGAHDAAGDVGRLAFSGVQPRTGEIQWETGENAEVVFSRARDGHLDSKREIADFIERLARALAMLVMTVDPAKVVVGGGLSRAHDEFLLPLTASVARNIQLPFEIPIVEARLGDEAAAHGALILAFRRKAFEIYGLEGMSVPGITPLVSTE
ncbi:MAG: ROK family protein [Leucobacter sp.]